MESCDAFRATLRRRGHLPPLLPHGGPFGLPADFLIAKDGRVIASKYGNHAFDQWSVDELLALAQSNREGKGRTELSPRSTMSW
jgi:hypothetical protein